MSAITTGYVASGTTATGPIDYSPNVTLQWPTDNDNTSGIAWHPHVSVPATGEVWQPSYICEDYYKQGDIFDPELHKSVDKAMKKIQEQLLESMAMQLDSDIMGISKEDEMPKSSERTVFNVFVIDPDGDGKVVAPLKNAIAQGSDAAKLKAIYELSQQADKLEKDLEDYDLLVEDVADFGSIRPKKE